MNTANIPESWHEGFLTLPKQQQEKILGFTSQIHGLLQDSTVYHDITAGEHHHEIPSSKILASKDNPFNNNSNHEVTESQANTYHHPSQWGEIPSLSWPSVEEQTKPLLDEEHAGSIPGETNASNENNIKDLSSTLDVPESSSTTKMKVVDDSLRSTSNELNSVGHPETVLNSSNSLLLPHSDSIIMTNLPTSLMEEDKQLHPNSSNSLSSNPLKKKGVNRRKQRKQTGQRKPKEKKTKSKQRGNPPHSNQDTTVNPVKNHQDNANLFVVEDQTDLCIENDMASKVLDTTSAAHSSSMRSGSEVLGASYVDAHHISPSHGFYGGMVVTHDMHVNGASTAPMYGFSHYHPSFHNPNFPTHHHSHQSQNQEHGTAISGLGDMFGRNVGTTGNPDHAGGLAMEEERFSDYLLDDPENEDVGDNQSGISTCNGKASSPNSRKNNGNNGLTKDRKNNSGQFDHNREKQEQNSQQHQQFTKQLQQQYYQHPMIPFDPSTIHPMIHFQDSFMAHELMYGAGHPPQQYYPHYHFQNYQNQLQSRLTSQNQTSDGFGSNTSISSLPSTELLHLSMQFAAAPAAGPNTLSSQRSLSTMNPSTSNTSPNSSSMNIMDTNNSNHNNHGGESVTLPSTHSIYSRLAVPLQHHPNPYGYPGLAAGGGGGFYPHSFMPVNTSTSTDNINNNTTTAGVNMHYPNLSSVDNMNLVSNHPYFSPYDPNTTNIHLSALQAQPIQQQSNTNEYKRETLKKKYTKNNSQVALKSKNYLNHAVSASHLAAGTPMIAPSAIPVSSNMHDHQAQDNIMNHSQKQQQQPKNHQTYLHQNNNTNNVTNALMMVGLKKGLRAPGQPTNVEATDKVDRKTLKRLRNRVSASRCRIKKKVWLQDLEERHAYLKQRHLMVQERFRILHDTVMFCRLSLQHQEVK